VRSTIPAGRQIPATAQGGTFNAVAIPTAHPLGPILFQVDRERPFFTRATAALILAGCVSLFTIATRLEPAAGGIGTHEQLGLPPCGMAMIWGLPCPTCGMTTAFAYAARGQFAAAFHAQPAGLTLALATGLGAFAAGGTLVTGRSYRVNWTRLSPTAVGFGVVAVVLGAWVYKLATALPR
jgi:hypothetical protein